MAWDRIFWFLAQVPNPDQEPLSTNLQWLRIPQGNTATITMFFFVMMAIVVTVLVTLLIQGWLQNLLNRLPHRGNGRANLIAQRLDPELRAILDRLKPDAESKHVEELLTDSAKFEHAVARHVERAPLQEDLSGFGRLRRRVGLTAMNPLTEVVSTRQLLPDLTVRIVASIGPEKLDLYCPLLEVNERHLLIDVPYQHEYFELLTQHPDVYLLFWRESDGETAFKVHLLPLHSGHISAFRCEHAMRSEDAAARTDFRLTVDIPVAYQFLDMESLAARKQGSKEVAPVRGEARLVDLSHGGAAFLSEAHLSEHGFAQLHFTLGDRPVRLMLEVLHQVTLPDGKILVRGKFRGLTPELGGMLHAYLSKEQFKRIQMHPALRVGTRAAEPTGSNEPETPSTPASAQVPVGQEAGAGESAPAAQARPTAPARPPQKAARLPRPTPVAPTGHAPPVPPGAAAGMGTPKPAPVGPPRPGSKPPGGRQP